MSGPTIRKQLPCVKCGYDLEGLEAQAKCPECGQDIVATLASRLDPATEALERSHELLRTAWALEFMSLGAVLGCAIGAAPVIDALRESLTPPAWLAPGVDGVRAVAPLAATVGAALGVFASFVVLPRVELRGYARARYLGGLGFVAWLVLSLQKPSFEAALAALAAVAAVAGSVTPILRMLVPHSRLFRTARHATQTTRDLLIAAGVAAGSGAVALAVRRQPGNDPDMAIIPSVAAYASAMLLVVGLCYRLVNAHWILRSVRRPPPRVDDLLGS